MKTYVFDIDGTICSNTYGKYELAKPYKERIALINNLFKQGSVIKYFSARGSTTGIDWYELTNNQLKEWGALYNELILNKPEGDIYIDDKGFNSESWIFPKGKDPNKKIVINENFILKESIFNHIEVLNKLLLDSKINNQLINVCKKVRETLKKGGKIIFAGNGGSFSDSQHLAAEFVSRFKTDRIPLSAISLGTNSSNLTAIGNDYGFEDVFARELIAIGKEKDLLLALTTSGNSKNIIKLIDESINLKIPFFILTGHSGGVLAMHNEKVLKVPSEETAIIQQIHIILGHIICKNSELPFLKKSNNF
tara:strand:+ start:3514 stop:4437 length:924 start_codon:yes stop_codon:yes gene_type:complete